MTISKELGEKLAVWADQTKERRRSNVYKAMEAVLSSGTDCADAVNVVGSTDTINILAIDPGTTSGIAHAHITAEGKIMIAPHQRVMADMYRYLCEIPLMKGIDVIVVERYQPNPNTSQRMGFSTDGQDAIDLIGALKFLGWLTGKEVVMQSSSQAKQGANDKYLQHIGIDTRKVGKHALDATRHAIVYWERMLRMEDKK